MKIPDKYLKDNQHGLFLLLTLGVIFSLALGFGFRHQSLVSPPVRPGPGIDGGFGPTSAVSLALKPETKHVLLEKGRLRLDGPPVWTLPEKDPDPGKIPLAESQGFYAVTGSKTPVMDKFEIDLIAFSSNPDTHLHVRQVDHNELGFGGGFKIALELIKDF